MAACSFAGFVEHDFADTALSQHSIEENILNSLKLEGEKWFFFR